MKVYIVGDACAGKSTFLNQFSDSRFAIFFEEGLSKIPPLLEENKFFGYLWFYLYYYNRDCLIKTDKIPIIERGLHEDYALLEACHQTGRVDDKQKEIMHYVIDLMMKDLPLEKDDLVINFICQNEVVKKRLKGRGQKNKTFNKDHYWDIYRTELKKFYPDKCEYWEIDTSELTPDQMSKLVSEKIYAHCGTKK